MIKRLLCWLLGHTIAPNSPDITPCLRCHRQVNTWYDYWRMRR